MNLSTRPELRPACPHFSSGPCAKRPGWSAAALEGALVGRSHRSAEGRAKLEAVIARSRALAEMPGDYVLGIVPASDTGAVEMALWSLLGARGVDVLVWESFGKGWATDVLGQLKLADVRVIEADYGDLPDLAQVDFSRDVVFTWNGTTSGVRVPDGEWIAASRAGLTICDATSAIFGIEMPWDMLDVVTYSWQKVLGGEGAHGMLALSPRAVERLEAHTPAWPLPKIFRLTTDGKLDAAVFKGQTINTPSMLAVEDALDSLAWAESVGGGPALRRRVAENFAVIEEWVERTPWVDFLASDKRTRSPTSVCLKVVDAWFAALGPDRRAGAAKRLVAILAEECVAFDVGSYRSAPPGLRIWAGATVEREDLVRLMPWLDWAHGRVKSEFAEV